MLNRPSPSSSMGPPPPRDNPAQKPPNLDTAEKYSRLKKKYFELKDRCEDLNDELLRCGERNVLLRSERSALLDRILELQDQVARISNGEPPNNQPPYSGAFSRGVLNVRPEVLNNVRQAMIELETEDLSVDPRTLSKHVSPRKRPNADEAKAAEDARDQKRNKKKAGTVSSSTTASTAGRNNALDVWGNPPLPHPNPNAANPDQILPRLSPPPGMSYVEGVPQGRINPNDRAAPTIWRNESGTITFAIPRLGDWVILVPREEAVKAPVIDTRKNIPSYLLGGNKTPPSNQATASLETYATLSPNRSPPHPWIGPDDDDPPAPSNDKPSDESAATPIPTPQIPTSESVQSPSVRSTESPSIPDNSFSHRSAGPSDIQRSTKPKRLKAHTVTSKSHNISKIPRDHNGKPILPFTLGGNITVIHLGEVCLREHFHTERYIFPVGYEISKRYASTIDPNSETTYTCTIIDGVDAPKFQIVPADRSRSPIIAGTATGAWSGIVKAANQIRNKQHSNSVSGPDFFGLGQNVIKHLIQELPGADRLRDYVWQNFVEGGTLGGRHAPVIPAVPDQPSLDTEAYPPGDYYYSERERERGRNDKDRDTKPPRDEIIDPGRDMDAHTSMDVDATAPPPPPAIPEDDYHVRPRRSPRTSRHSAGTPSRHERPGADWGAEDVRMNSEHRHTPVNDRDHYHSDPLRRHSVSSSSRSPAIHRDQRDREYDQEREQGHGYGYDVKEYRSPPGAGSPPHLASSPSTRHGLANIMHSYSADAERHRDRDRERERESSPHYWTGA